MCACSDLVQWSAANESRLLVGTDGGSRLVVDRLVAQGHPRDATEVAVEGWLAFVRADCVKSVDSQNISWADRTEMCLGAFDCALDIPPPTRRLRARISGVMQSPAISC